MIWLPAGAYRGTELHCMTKDAVSEAAASRKYEQAVHELASFAVDRRRTSCADYGKCVDAHACAPFGDTFYEHCADDGVVSVSLEQARAYCEWRHLRVPSYYEWQAAVRGPKGNLYPNGDTPPDCYQRETSTSIERLPCPFTTHEGVEYVLQDYEDEWTRDSECTIDKRGLEVTSVVAVTAAINLDIPGFFHHGAKFRCVNDRPATAPR
jgi:formylglycine-generating enzyme required for sulfatase activity